jgi:hypothetical protein
MRRASVSLPLLLLLALPAALSAQFGNIKKKVTDAAKPPATQPAPGAQPKCDASTLVITPEVVDRYLKALAAGDGEMARLAKQPGDTGKYWSAYLRAQQQQQRKLEFDAHRGPDWQKYQGYQARIEKGDTTAVQPMVAIQRDVDAQVQMPDVSWEVQRAGNNRLDEVKRQAGGFSVCDWTNGIQEKLPRTVQALANNDDQKQVEQQLSGQVTPAEISAVKPKLSELARELGIRYRSPEDRKREQQEQQAAVQRQMDPRSACLVKASQAFADAHKTELEAAQKAGDVNAMLKLSQLQQAEMAKCYSNGQ